MTNSAQVLIDYFGGTGAVAAALGIRSQAVSRWIREKSVPEARAYQVEVLTRGKLKAANLLKK
jgi:DNA-binding transcriptional regulator YdaS (Cro superfamily)